MIGYIEVPQANLRNIAIFGEEPQETLLAEIKKHIRETHCPHTWRGHSHTKPPQGALVVYCDEFDVPAPDTVLRVAPCPCCNPHHPQYKNKGKVAWFPEERVIRLIGPQCFKAINEAAHETAIIDLRKKQKARSELAAIRLHGPRIPGLISVIDAVLPIAGALDDFMQAFNAAFDNELSIPLWRAAKSGTLTVDEIQNVSYRKPDGSIDVRRETVAIPFANITGQAMVDRSGPVSAAKKLMPLRSGLIAINRRLADVGPLEKLTEAERADFSEKIPKARKVLDDVLRDARLRQSFLASGTLEVLAQWGRHPHAPYRFTLQRRGNGIALSSPNQRHGQSRINIEIATTAIEQLPDLPAIGEVRG